MIAIELCIDRHISESDITEVAICLDRTGIDKLCFLLQNLKNSTDEHIHLATPDWGGEGLDSQRYGGDNYILVNQLRIVKIQRKLGI